MECHNFDLQHIQPAAASSSFDLKLSSTGIFQLDEIYLRWKYSLIFIFSVDQVFYIQLSECFNFVTATDHLLVV